MPDRTVILTMVDESMASPGSLLEILLQSFKSGEGTQRLVNHLVIITMDLQAFEYCRSLHPYCIHPSIFPHQFATTKTQSSMRTPAYKLFTWTRRDVLFEVIRLGYNIIFTVRLLTSFLKNTNNLILSNILCEADIISRVSINFSKEKRVNILQVWCRKWWMNSY